MLREGTLERFEAQTPTKFHVKVAHIDRFRNDHDEDGDFESSLETMAALFSAPTIEVTISTRGVDGGLDKPSLLSTLRRLLHLKDQGSPIKSITAETSEAEDPFNFIQQLLKDTQTLDLPRNDPVQARQIRMDHVRDTYGLHRDHLTAAYDQLGPV